MTKFYIDSLSWGLIHVCRKSYLGLDPFFGHMAEKLAFVSSYLNFSQLLIKNLCNLLNENGMCNKSFDQAKNKTNPVFLKGCREWNMLPAINIISFKLETLTSSP